MNIYLNSAFTSELQRGTFPQGCCRVGFMVGGTQSYSQKKIPKKFLKIILVILTICLLLYFTIKQLFI